jgi:putrescine transport system substrate-binding protein
LLGQLPEKEGKDSPMSILIRRALAACFLFAVLVGGASAADREVHVFNWSDYIDESLLGEFTEESGIKVIYDVYDSNDILETKLLAGNSGYDLVFPTGSFLARQITAGVFQPLDRSKLPNWENLDPKVMAEVARYDPENTHGVVYMWGTTGFAYNDQMIKERMPDAPVNSWDMILDPDVVSRFADCGVYIIDASDEMIPAALNYIGEDPNSKDPEVIQKAEAVLMAVRPYVRKFHSSENINALANGDICLAVIWSGDAGIAAGRAEEAEKPFSVEYVIPNEGALMWFDIMAVPKDAPDADAAHAFMNFLMRPEVIARATNYVTYPNANAASKPFIDPEILNDPTIYPPQEVMERLFTVTPYNQRTQRVVTRLWQRVKTGN